MLKLKKIRTKRRIIGVTIFSFYFLLIGSFSLIAKFAFPGVVDKELRKNYSTAQESVFKGLFILQQKGVVQIKSSKIPEFRSGINKLMMQLTQFKKSYLNIGSQVKTNRSIRFFSLSSSIIYLVSGIMLLMRYSLARQLTYFAVTLSFILNFNLSLFAYQTFVRFQTLVNQYMRLVLYLQSEAQALKEMLPITLRFISSTHWINALFIVNICLVVLFPVFVLYYFSRPRVKEQFR